MRVINTQRIPIKAWTKDIEEGAIAQAENLASLPFVYKHVALMPDVHQGYGMPIGGVIATEGVIIPNAVGVDIGCGMCTIHTNMKAVDLTEDMLKSIMGKIRKVVPVGFNRHKNYQEWKGFREAPDSIEIIDQEIDNARTQLGTLGGGNHFIEIQKSDVGDVWIMVHSGSRNFGKKIADYYHKMALKFCEKWYSNIPDKDLAFLPIDNVYGEEYIVAMNYALAFALENRKRILDEACFAFWEVTGFNFPEYLINIHHNFAKLENHFGKNVWVHRKGATQAYKGQIGIIPGSMGTPSYIVEGLGNPESFKSCSHGAGRKMGRAQASRTLTVEECDKAMKGIIYGRWGKDRKGRIDLGEAPQAYKDIEDVIESELDLIKPITKLWPMAVIKG